MHDITPNFDEIQKAMEDTTRDAFDYFIDKESGELIILSIDIINKAHEIISQSYDDDISDYEDVEPDVLPDIPQWMEDEIELALEIFMDGSMRYIRIPERNPSNTFASMLDFIQTLTNEELKQDMLKLLDGPGAFRKFKDAIASFQKEKKLWHRFNAKRAKKEIEEFLIYNNITLPHQPG